MENSKPVKNKNVTVTDTFWLEKINLVKNVVIPYQWQVLNDRVEGVEKSHCIRNFKLANKVISERNSGKTVPTFKTDKYCYTPQNSDPNSFLGWVFQDTDLYKWLEAVAYSLENEEDRELMALADEAVNFICGAQEKNGYIDTFYTINNPAKIFTNLKDHHELYCFGHLAEAAVAYYEATGKNKLLNAAIKFADFICDYFSDEKCPGYPGHEIAELALVKLYNVTDNENYLKMAETFIKRRGTKPYYFDVEQGIENSGDTKYQYHQAHMPVYEQTEAVGHAVRATYLYTGMACAAKELNDEKLLNVCKSLFNNIANKKMYITGGIGSTCNGEAFTYDYHLPNDTAYAETCASVGLIFFANSMLQNDTNSKYANAIERALYNTVLAGMAEDGKSFFYSNPLELNPVSSKGDPNKKFISTTRQGWFSCACCPPNIARLLSNIGEYCFTENENTVFVNLYINSSAKCKNANIEVSGDYVNTGKVNVKITPKKAVKIALRIPEWCTNFTFSQKNPFIKNGYAYFDIDEKTEITANFNPTIKIIKSHPMVQNNIDKVAITRGPTVYCLEEADNGKNLHLLRLAKNPKFKFDGENITANGFREIISQSKLYEEYTECEETQTKLTFIPFYKHANRTDGEMCVYVRYGGR